jgi:hypothetical protein
VAPIVEDPPPTGCREKDFHPAAADAAREEARQKVRAALAAWSTEQSAVGLPERTSTANEDAGDHEDTM